MNYQLIKKDFREGCIILDRVHLRIDLKQQRIFWCEKCLI